MRKIYDYFQEKLLLLKEEKINIENQIRQRERAIEAMEEKINVLKNQENETDAIFLSHDARENCRVPGQELQKDKEAVLEQLQEWEKKKETNAQDIEKYFELSNSFRTYLQEKEAETKFFDENYVLEFDGPIQGEDILKIQELERERIARDIHDSVIQKLTALTHKSEFCVRVIDSDKSRVKLELKNIEEVARECINELRDIIYDLRPMELNDLGLYAAIQQCVEQLQRTTEMNIQLTMPKEKKQINSFISITCVRIVQELCNNSIKHSQGENIYIKMAFRGNKLYIEVSDDGHGIEKYCEDKTMAKQDKSGYGLSMMRERVALLGGKINFINLKKGGCYCKVSLPILLKGEQEND